MSHASNMITSMTTPAPTTADLSSGIVSLSELEVSSQQTPMMPPPWFQKSSA